MAIFTTLKVVTTDSTPKTYYFRGKSDIYTGAVATSTGVTIAPPAEANSPLTKVEELVGKGVLIRLMASTGQLGSSDRKEVKLVCLKSQISTAFTSLEGENIRGNSILSVRVPQKATFY